MGQVDELPFMRNWVGFWFGLGFFSFLGWEGGCLICFGILFLASDNAGVDSQPCSSDSAGFQVGETCSLSSPEWCAQPELPRCIAGSSPYDLCALRSWGEEAFSPLAPSFQSQSEGSARPTPVMKCSVVDSCCCGRWTSCFPARAVSVLQSAGRWWIAGTR